MNWLRIVLILTANLCILGVITYGQEVRIKGNIIDSHTEEPIPFASIQFKNTTIGKLSDSAGHFSFYFSSLPSDTLLITYVGFQGRAIHLDPTQKEFDLIVRMERGKRENEVVVRGKINRGLLLWRRIVKNKPINDRSKFENFSYELYNKLEIDLNKVNKQKMEKSFIPKPFKFVLENIDTTSEDNPILPVYLTETISDYYFQGDPRKAREVIKANKTVGINNESVAKFLGGMYQNINVYQNFIPVFDREFVSPISNNGDAYYIYKVPDTQFVANKRYFHFVFYPKRKGQNTFQGDAWIADSSYAVQKMNLRLSPDANVNFIQRLSLVQEYQLIQDSIWFLSKDKFVADFSLAGRKLLNLIGRKTTTYRNVVLNDTSVTSALENSSIKEEIVMSKESRNRTDEYWKEHRHEPLNKNERGIYHMVDTLTQMPAFKKYTEWINFIATGYMNVGKFQIGPWYNWISGNVYEGFRMRFDLGTNKYFSKKIYLSTYLAYGFTDKKIKGKLEALYLLNKSPRSTLHALYRNDIDYGQTYYDEVGYDNIFALAFRKSEVPVKLLRLNQQKLEYFKEWKNGFSITATLHRKIYDPLVNLPPKSAYPDPKDGETFNNFEASIRFRFAYLEQFLENNFFRTSLGSIYPIMELAFARGIPGIFNSNYQYTKIHFSVSDYVKIPPLGSLYYNAYVGKVFGTLPYMFLSIAPGNEIYYYNKYAFNLMNRYEYILDQYAGFSLEHNIGNGLFRFLPPTRILKWRQFWNVRLLWGNLSQANKDLNFNNGYPFQTLGGKPYMEIGTGVDNILRFLRLDLVWRVLPQPLPSEKYKRFGIFGSFRLSF